MRLISFFTGLVILSATLFAEAAWGQGLCVPRDKIVSDLLRQYKERPHAMGIANNGGVLELLRTDKGETFTLIITMPNGIACPVAAGEDWQPVIPVKGEGL